VPGRYAPSYDLQVRLAIAETARLSRSSNADAWDPWEDRFHRRVDPDRKLDSRERAIRAEHARKAHYARLALARAKVRGADDSTIRRLIGRIASHERWARGGHAEQGQKSAAAQLRRYERVVDPENTLDPAERTKRARDARSQDMRQMAAMSRLRRREREQKAIGAKPVSVAEATARIAKGSIRH
jgi:hypothetical protein